MSNIWWLNSHWGFHCSVIMGFIRLFFLHRVRNVELEHTHILAALPKYSASLFDIFHVSGLLGLPRCYIQNNSHLKNIALHVWKSSGQPSDTISSLQQPWGLQLLKLQPWCCQCYARHQKNNSKAKELKAPQLSSPSCHGETAIAHGSGSQALTFQLHWQTKSCSRTSLKTQKAMYRDEPKETLHLGACMGWELKPAKAKSNCL